MTGGSEIKVFAALGDPVRFSLVRTLAREGPASTTALAAPLTITRQAVDQHLRILRELGVVSSIRVGRETRHRIEKPALTAAASWLDAVASEWDAQLALIRALAEDLSPDGEDDRRQAD